MSEVIIKFNEWSKDKLLKKTKLATTRTRRHGKHGDTFQVRIDGSMYEYEILAVFPIKLYYVTKELYHIEGADSPLDFKKVWEDIHPKAGWTPEKIVYVHLFRMMEVL